MSAARKIGCGERFRRRAMRLALAPLLAVVGAAVLALPASAPASAQAIESLMSREEVAEMEELLDRLSFNPGQIDGLVDADTERAIKAYQEFAVLPVDGLASRGLLNELRAVASHLDAPAPTEQAEAEEKAAEQAAAEQRAAEQRAAEEKAAAEQAAAEKAAAEKAEAERLAAEQRAAEQRAAEQRAAEQRATEEAEAEQRAAEQRAAEEAEAEQRAAEQRAAEQRAAEQAEAERLAAEQRAAEQRAAEQAEAEQRAAEQRAAEQRAAEQRAAEQRAAEQRAAEQAEAERLAAEQRAAQQQTGSDPASAAEAERLAAAEQAAAEQEAAEREAALQTARERVATASAAERAEAERIALAELQAARERVAAATAAAERAAAARAAAERAAAERAANAETANAPAQQQARLPASRDGGWRLQLSSLQPLERAQATWSQIEHSHAALAGLSFLPEPLVLNGRDFARVLAGPLDESEARRRCEALELSGIYCLPVAGNPGYGIVVEEPPAGNLPPPAPGDSAPLPGTPAQPSSSVAPAPRPALASLAQPQPTTRPRADRAAPCLLPPGATPQRLVETGNDFRAGYEAAGRGNFDLAIAYYGRALEAPGLDDNMRALLHYNCGNALHYRGDFVRATVNFDRALSLNDRLVDARYNRGFAHRALGKTAEATADFRTAHDMGLRRLGVRAPDYAPPK